MSSTKRAFLNAGSIVSIVLAVIGILGGVLLCASSTLASESMIKQIYENDSTYTLHTKTENPDDSLTDDNDYYFTYQEGDKTLKITRKSIVELANVTSAVLNVTGWYSILLSVACIVVSALVLKDASRNSNRKANIITLLVLSVLTGNLITMAFMIVGLCLKNRPENVVVVETQQ